MPQEPSYERKVPERSVWDRCLELFDDAGAFDWTPSMIEEFDEQRSIEWFDFPYVVYRLHEYSLNRVAHSGERVTGMIELLKFDTEGSARGVRQFSKFFLSDGRFTGILRTERKNEDISEGDTDGIISSFDFCLENGLIAPNKDDEEELVRAIDSGVNAGPTPYMQKN